MEFLTRKFVTALKSGIDRQSEIKGKLENLFKISLFSELKKTGRRGQNKQVGQKRGKQNKLGVRNNSGQVWKFKQPTKCMYSEHKRIKCNGIKCNYDAMPTNY